MLWPAGAAAQTRSLTASLPDFQGPYVNSAPFPFLTIGTFTYALVPGESVAGATVSGTWGNDYYPNGSAGAAVYLDGLLVATCLANTTCWFDAPPDRVPWSYSFTSAQLGNLNDGQAVLTAQMTSSVVVELGALRLALTVQSPPIITVTGGGTGSGVVTSQAGLSPAVNCAVANGVATGACSQNYPGQPTVTLTATPAGGSAFSGWTGASSGFCSGTTCTLPMTLARAVTATFTALPPQALTVSKSGSGTGTVTSTPSGISCGPTCTASFTAGTAVTLTASAATGLDGSVFMGWSGGGCSGRGTCTVTMNAATTVTATFARSITSSTPPDGLVSQPYSHTFTASVPTGSPAPTWQLMAGGFPPGLALNASTGVLSGTPTTAGSYAATITPFQGTSYQSFTITIANPAPITLTVSKAGSGRGTVTSSPSGISCGTSCTQAAFGYSPGATVTLTASAVVGLDGSVFMGWSGGGCSGTGTCTVTMNAATTVTATFAPGITSPPPPNGTVSQPYSHTFTASVPAGSPAPSWRLTTGGLPPGLSLNASAGTLGGTPTAAGSYPATITPFPGTSLQSFTITITAAVLPPTCTLTAAPSALVAGTGGTVTLTANCTGSPTSYTWSASAGAPAVSGSGSTVTASFALATPAGTYTYTVRGTNAGGTGAAASATVIVNAPAPTPACTITGPDYYVSGGPATTLSASCSPAATSYTWTGGTCAGVTGPTCTVSPAATTTYSVAGRNANGTGPSTRKTVVVAAQKFPITVTSNVTPTLSSATAQIQVRPEDVGSTTSIFVFAHVPASRLAAPSTSGTAEPKALEKAGGPDPCVLAQLLSNGQLVGVSFASMQAYLTAALSSQGRAVTILNNVPTPNVAGATFYVGYGPTAMLMFTNGTYQGAVTIPGPSQCNTTLLAAAPARSPDGLTGLWWNRAEPGWGVHFTQRRNVVFAAMYIYDPAGNPKWYVAPSCSMGTASTATGTCTGSLYEARGPVFFGTAFNPAAVIPIVAGSLQVGFQTNDSALMSYTIDAQGRTVALTRQLFSSGPSPPAVDYTDLWFNPDESGWGLAITQQYGVMFLAWYVYDDAGRPIWLVASNCIVSGSSCAGDLYRTTGPSFGPTFDPSRVQPFFAGTVNVNFIDANNATLTYTVNGVREVKFIKRQEF